MTIEFTRLPLIEVGLRLVLDDAAGHQSQARTPKRAFPPTWTVMPESTTPDANAAVELLREAEGLHAMIGPAGLFLYWSNAHGKPYVRYPRMTQLFDELVKGTGRLLGDDFRPALTGIRYRQMIGPVTSGQLRVARYLQPEFARVESEARMIYDSTTAWREAGIDHRIAIERVHVRPAQPQDTSIQEQPDQEAFVLATSSGMMLDSGDDWRQALDRAHDTIQQIFEAAITNEAKEEWGYVGFST